MGLTFDEKIRYSRHLKLNQFGIESQEKLKASKVLVVGTGGLGAPILQYLTAAGVGVIGVMDFDRVDATNLQRQVLFGTSDIGEMKTTVAIRKMKEQNPHVTFIEHQETLNSDNAMEIIQGYDIVADGTDNFPTRYLVNDACFLAGKPYVYASIYQFEGQVSVFNYNDGPNYRDLFPTPPPPGLVPSCAEGGVLGVLPGIIGSIQASEVIKVLTGIGNPLSGRLFLFEALGFTTRTLNIRKDPTNPLSDEKRTITKLIDYDEFCGLNVKTTMKSITVEELHALKDSGQAFTLIDVREPYEYEAGNLEGINIPLSSITDHLDQIPQLGNVILHCRSGKRSADAIKLLEEKYTYTNLTNLDGGMLSWKEKIEPQLTVI